MTLSIAKLEELLRTNSLLIKKKFIIPGMAVYLEIFNINNAETFLLYIPSKYKIHVDDLNSSYKIKYIDIKDEYTFNNLEDKINEISSERQYGEIQMKLSPSNDVDLESSLKDNYDHEILVKDLSKEDVEHLKNIFYQLCRLKLCVKGIKYKLAIVYKNYLCAIRRDNEIECFVIRGFKSQNEKNIYAVIDIENLYKKIDNISSDIMSVKNGLYKILSDNQIKHARILNNILEQKNSIMLSSESVYIKKKEMEEHIKKLELLLYQINESERTVIDKLVHIQSSSSLYGDMQRSHEVYKYEKELDTINNIKQEVVKDIINIRNRKENITLEIDRILFDNSIMLNTINKNFNDILKIFNKSI